MSKLTSEGDSKEALQSGRLGLTFFLGSYMTHRRSGDNARTCLIWLSWTLKLILQEPCAILGKWCKQLWAAVIWRQICLPSRVVDVILGLKQDLKEQFKGHIKLEKWFLFMCSLSTNLSPFSTLSLSCLFVVRNFYSSEWSLDGFSPSSIGN